MTGKLLLVAATLMTDLLVATFMVVIMRYGLGISTVERDLETIDGYLDRLSRNGRSLHREDHTRVHVIIPNNTEDAG